MAEVVGFFANVGSTLLDSYNFFTSAFKDFPVVFSLIQILFLAVFIILITFLLWAFYKTLSKRDLIKLNLHKYNYADYDLGRKFSAVLLYFVEYIIIIPFFLLVWTSIFSVVLLLLAQENIKYMMILTSALIIAVRALAYYNEEISQELAKLFPLVLLSTFLVSPKLLDMASITAQISLIPTIFEEIIYYLLIIFFVEILFRGLSAVIDVWRDDED